MWESPVIQFIQQNHVKHVYIPGTGNLKVKGDMASATKFTIYGRKNNIKQVNNNS